ncbi:MAG TPA: rRNA maturation RNase YbeY [Rubricoccaceae bacterium]
MSGPADVGGPPEMGLEVTLDHERLALDEAEVRAVVEAVCRGEGVRVENLSVVLGGHALVHEINRDWLGHDYETDVLSFVLDEEARPRGGIDGEVYVDLDTAEERAPEFGSTLRAEALRYVAHGVLHLVGHDDVTDELRSAMRALEDRYLADAGVMD